MKKKPASKRQPRKQAADPNAFAGITLQPFTKQREVTACEMGLRFGFVSQYRPQWFLKDTIIVLWLCSIPVDGKEEWTVDRAEQDPEGAWKQALKWAEEIALGVDTPRLAEGYKRFTAIIHQVQKARGTPIIPKGDQREAPDSEL